MSTYELYNAIHICIHNVCILIIFVYKIIVYTYVFHIQNVYILILKEINACSSTNISQILFFQDLYVEYNFKI
jgi:hypothetical protein